MDRAKAAVSEFMHKAGHHDTTVEEKVAPAVVQEKVVKTRHEEVVGAVDREVHQDHYHVSVQPIKDREVLPEQHTTRAVPVETRELHHGDAAAVQARLEQERGQFRDSHVEVATQHTTSEAPVIAGEHRHHHVHEVIQPVVQREVIQPTVVHTVVPVHEVHHNEPKYHAATTLPTMSMSEFKAQGGSLSGRETRVDGFEGEPRAVANTTGAATTTTSTMGVTGRSRSRSSSRERRSGTTGRSSGGIGGAISNVVGSLTGRGHQNDHHNDSSSHSGMPGATGAGMTSLGGTHTGTGGMSGPLGTTGTTERTTIGTTGTTGHKPTLKEKLDPRVDADGDGKAGVMS